MKIPDLLSHRRHRRGDLRDGGRAGGRRQVPLPEKRDVPEPGSEKRQTGRGAGLPLQQPGRVPEPLGGKPQGVFYISGITAGLPEQEAELEDFLTRLWTLRAAGLEVAPQNRRRAKRGSSPPPHKFTDLTPTVPDTPANLCTKL